MSRRTRHRCVPRMAALALAVIAAALTPVAAEERWYTVEIVVFERTSGEGLAAEMWPEQVEEPSRGLTLSAGGNDGVGILGSSGGSQRVQPVPRGQLAYGNVSARLSRSGRYRTLLHMGWRQPGLDRTQALPVSLGGSSQSLGGGVRGTVRLYVSRYLHLEAHLLYSSPEALGGTPFELVESRRMRSGELHYFDHPVFGMLARITPYQPPGGEYLPSQEAPAPQPEAEAPATPPAS